jgi:lipoyl(octanoyl) transferase
VNGAKIAALGFRVRRGCCYHGLALNVDGDLRPFERINPCGYAGLSVTSLAVLGRELAVDEAGDRLAGYLAATLSLPVAGDLDGIAGRAARGAGQRPLTETTT